MGERSIVDHYHMSFCDMDLLGAIHLVCPSISHPDGKWDSFLFSGLNYIARHEIMAFPRCELFLD